METKNELKIDVKINGESYSQNQLYRYQYERALHALHELKYLGGRLYDGEKELSHEDINWLEPERLQEILLQERSALGEEGILKMFDNILNDTEKRFAEFTKNYTKGDVWTGQTELIVSGIQLKEFLPVMGGASSYDALSLMPEHYIVVGDIHEGQRGMEVFGMFGEPAYVHGISNKEIPDHFPFKEDPDYPITLFGEMKFRRSDAPLHLGALHQFNPTADGFKMKSIFFCPKGAPRIMADGHSIHFAIELCNGAKLAHRKKMV